MFGWRWADVWKGEGNKEGGRRRIREERVLSVCHERLQMKRQAQQQWVNPI